MVDTGADISLIKLAHFKVNEINTNNISTLSGIGQGKIRSIGTTHFDLRYKKYLIPHTFHVVDDDFPIPCDGIIGMDFIRRFNCVLDFNEDVNYLILRPQNLTEQIEIELTNTCNELLTLPARSEVIRQIRLITSSKELLVPHQEIKPGVFIASTLVRANNAFIRILNTNSNTVTIEESQISTEDINDYEIIPNKSYEHKRNTKILEILRKNFPKQFENTLTNLCTKFSDVFGLESEVITTNNFYEQKLRVKDKQPVYIKNYRIPHTHKEEIERQVTKLISDGIVEPSHSEYNSPILLVPKKSLPSSKEKRWRLVIDYRQINKKLVADKFPLPRIDDILDQLGRAKYFSCLDLMSGFHQIQLEKKSRDLTSFSTNNGSYKFTRLPYGLKIAPNSFQRMMTIAFSGLKPEQAFLYMDDLVVLGCSEKHMLSNLTDIFELCRKNNLKLHPEKC